MNANCTKNKSLCKFFTLNIKTVSQAKQHRLQAVSSHPFKKERKIIISGTIFYVTKIVSSGG
jgi:hypothetical protein